MKNCRQGLNTIAVLSLPMTAIVYYLLSITLYLNSNLSFINQL